MSSESNVLQFPKLEEIVQGSEELDRSKAMIDLMMGIASSFFSRICTLVGPNFFDGSQTPRIQVSLGRFYAIDVSPEGRFRLWRGAQVVSAGSSLPSADIGPIRQQIVPALERLLSYYELGAQFMVFLAPFTEAAKGGQVCIVVRVEV